MRKMILRQFVALTLLALFAPAVHAQFQKLYYHSPLLNPAGGIFKDVECLEVAGANGEAIVSVGTDSRAVSNGLISYHDVAGLPLTYLLATNPTAPGGHPVDAAAICRTPLLNNVVACFYDPIDKASDIICASAIGGVNWIKRIPNFQVRDVSAGTPDGIVERIYFTGNTTDLATTRVAVACLDGGGVTQYYKDYGIAAPTPYINQIGFEIDYKPATNTVTLVGKTSITNCYDGVLAMQLVPNTGNVNWTKVYYSQNCVYDWKGKALVQKPGAGNNYMIAFECKNPAVAGAVYPAVMEINAAGATAGNVQYFTAPAGFFLGSNYDVEGLDTDGNTLMLSGSLKNGTNLQLSGYSLQVSMALAHNGLRYNEYETAGAYNPQETHLVDMDYFAAQNKYVFGGAFKPGQGVNFPVPVAFWLVETAVNGLGVCSNNVAPINNALVRVTDAPVEVPNPRDGIGQSPVGAAAVAKAQRDQCVAAAKVGDADVEGMQAPVFAYLDGQRQILARIPADAKGLVSVTLLDMQGRVMQRASLPTGEHRLDVSQWATGVYFIQFQGDGIAAGVQKIAVR